VDFEKEIQPMLGSSKEEIFKTTVDFFNLKEYR
jgi:hypothetical protein